MLQDYMGGLQNKEGVMALVLAIAPQMGMPIKRALVWGGAIVVTDKNKNVILSPNCARCNCPRADFAYVIWHCPIIARFWQTVVEVLSAVLSIPVPLTPEVCLLGIRDEEIWA